MRQPVRKWVVRLILLVVMAGVALVAWRSFQQEETIEVRTVPLITGPLSLSVTTTGRLSPTTEVVVGCEVSGTVDAVLVDHNDSVKKGQEVARLKPEMYRAEHEQAKADLARAKAELHRLTVQEQEAQRQYDRVRGLYDEGAASDQEYKALLATYEAAKAATEAGQAAVLAAEGRVNLTQYRLERTVVTSPIDGIVLDRRVDAGQTIAATLQAPVLFVLAEELGRMELLADVSEADVGFLCPGQKASFTVNAYRDRSFPGVVRQIRNQPKAINNVVTYTVVIDVENQEHLLRPGMPADVTIRVVHRDEVSKVSNAALRFRPPLPPDETRRLLESVTWPDPPPPVTVSESPATAAHPEEISFVPPPIEPAKATLWQYVDEAWKPLPVWTLFTDNRETAVVTAADESDLAFAVEIHKKEGSRSMLQEAIMLARPENRGAVLTRSNQ